MSHCYIGLSRAFTGTDGVFDSYYHEDRTHLGLGKGTPDGRTRTIASGRVLSHVRLGGLHNRYNQAA